MWQKPMRVLAFGFGSGLSPSAPGTVGTLWAWLVALVFQNIWNEAAPEMVLALLVIGFLLGIVACGMTGHDLGKPDHGGMVWDEVIAFWIILVFVLPTSFVNQLIAFAIFRYFDAVKPGPIGMIDNWFKEWRPSDALAHWQVIGIRGFGVMIDDLAAALATLLAIALAIRIFE
jgi:phosphatidylglycerophosphatase A